MPNWFHADLLRKSFVCKKKVVPDSYVMTNGSSKSGFFQSQCGTGGERLSVIFFEKLVSSEWQEGKGEEEGVHGPEDYQSLFQDK